MRVSEYSKSSTSRNESLLAISLEGDISPCYHRGSYESSSGSSYESQESEGSSRSLPNPNSLLHEELDGSDRHITLTQSREFTDSNLPVSKETSDEDLCAKELDSPLVENLGVAGHDASTVLIVDEHNQLEQIVEGGGVEAVYNMVFHNDCTSVVQNGDEERHCTTDCVEEHLQATTVDSFRCSERLNGEKTVKDQAENLQMLDGKEQSSIGPQESHGGQQEGVNSIEVYSVGFSGMIILSSCEESRSHEDRS